MVLFALSVFLILLYIWATFGGPTPFAAKQYRIQVDFDEATQLAETADVRISGVTVGRVRKTRLHGDRTRATIEIKPEYAPLPRDTRASLRLKTLLGETYVELTPGQRSSGVMRDNEVLPRGHVASTVELDELLRAFDQPTRLALQRFVKGLAVATEDRGVDLNAAVGNLQPVAAQTTDLMTVLDSQRGAVRRLVADSGTVFAALGQRRGELQGLITAGDRVLRSTSRRNRELAETVEILPTTLREARPTLAALELLIADATPVVRDLRPAARALGPTLTDAVALAPELEGLFRDVDRVIDVADTALPATTRFVDAAVPVFRVLTPTLGELKPVVDFLEPRKREFTTMWANIASDNQASQVGANGQRLHYIRALVPMTAEGLVATGQRYGTNRHNPYFAPGGLADLKDGLKAFDCGNVNNQSPPGQLGPPCKLQPLQEFQGRRQAFPHVRSER
jgi:virulence factor Mce-like protein